MTERDQNLALAKWTQEVINLLLDCEALLRAVHAVDMPTTDMKISAATRANRCKVMARELETHSLGQHSDKSV